VILLLRLVFSVSIAFFSLSAFSSAVSPGGGRSSSASLSPSVVETVAAAAIIATASGI